MIGCCGFALGGRFCFKSMVLSSTMTLSACATASLTRVSILFLKMPCKASAGIAMKSPQKVVTRATEIPPASFAGCGWPPAITMASKSFIIPKTVPKRPTIGETFPIRYIHSILRSSRMAWSCRDSVTRLRILKKSPLPFVNASVIASVTRSSESCDCFLNWASPFIRIDAEMLSAMRSGSSFCLRMVRKCSTARNTVSRLIGSSTNQTIGPPAITNCSKKVWSASSARGMEFAGIIFAATMAAATIARIPTRTNILNIKLFCILASVIVPGSIINFPRCQ